MKFTEQTLRDIEFELGEWAVLKQAIIEVYKEAEEMERRDKKK